MAATRGPTVLPHENPALGAGKRVLARRVPRCEQVVLFNIATAATVAIGILTLYVAVFVLPFRELMTVYPQPRGRQPAVEYAPGAPERPTLPSRREQPRPAGAGRR